MIKQVDVLIIGGGLAGLMAALSASEHTNNLLLVSKGKIGRSGNTLVSGGGISAALDSKSGDNSVEAFYQDIIRSGKGLADANLVDKLASESGTMLRKLYDYGVQFIKEEDGSFRTRRPPGHSVPRNVPTKWNGIAYANRGLSFSVPVYEQCLTNEIPMLDGWTLHELLKSEHAVCGAVFVTKQQEQLVVKAKATVLASGGYGYLFEKSNNTSDIIGEGIAAALRVGCRVRDMEQVQFYPTMMFEPVKITASNPLFGEGAVLRNRAGERFMHKYDPAADMATRDNMARGIFQEIQAGLGINGGVYFDCTGIDKDRLLQRFGNFYEFLKKNGIDMTRDYLQVTPCVHYTLGGIVIDDRCQTNIAGLYAAGEITGGIHGANRLSGAALMETCVFGWQAGQSAALRSVSCQLPTYIPEQSFIPREIDRTVLNKLRRIMWEQVSLVRSKVGLEQALQEISALEQDSASINGQTMVCRAIIQSALLRAESRGAHYRVDYPEQLTEPRCYSTCCYLDEIKSVTASWLL